MKIKQEKEFKPLTLIIETKEEYDSFFRIIEEAGNVDAGYSQYIRGTDKDLIAALSNFATNNV